jgi:membrane-bound hydrogenase subunit beta
MQSRHNEVLEALRLKLNSKLITAELRERKEGADAPTVLYSVWAGIDREDLRAFVQVLLSFGPLHVSTPMASKEYEGRLELIYHFALFGGIEGVQELPVIVRVSLPKEDLTVETLTDLIPGILFMERETMEMLGVVVIRILDDSRLWTHDKLAAGFRPMRGLVHCEEEVEGEVK